MEVKIDLEKIDLQKAKVRKYLDLEISQENVMGLRLACCRITSLFTTATTSIPSNAQINSATYVCPFRIKMEGRKWIIETNHIANITSWFSGLDVKSESIVAWLDGNYLGSYTVTVKTPRKIYLEDPRIELHFYSEDVYVDFPPTVHVFGELTNGMTFYASEPNPGFRQRP